MRSSSMTSSRSFLRRDCASPMAASMTDCVVATSVLAARAPDLRRVVMGVRRVHLQPVLSPESASLRVFPHAAPVVVAHAFEKLPAALTCPPKRFERGFDRAVARERGESLLVVAEDGRRFQGQKPADACGGFDLAVSEVMDDLAWRPAVFRGAVQLVIGDAVERLGDSAIAIAKRLD